LDEPLGLAPKFRRIDNMQTDVPGSVNSPADLQIIPTGAAPKGQRNARWRRIFGTVVSYFLGQGALQAVNLLLGLFLVRMLSVEAYAQFGLAFGFQSTASNLMDLGFASTVIPLVGNRHNDRDVVGSYVHAALRLRTRAFLILAPFAVIGFFAITRTHHWGWRLELLLIVPVLIAIYSSGHVACCSAPFFLHRRLTDYYLPQTLSGMGRLVAYVILDIAGGLNAWTAAALSALNITLISRVLGKKCRQWVGWSNASTRPAEREIIHYVLPAMPALIFGALQAQISLFLIGIFGHTVGIAQVAALGRIAQLFLVLQSFNLAVVEPYIARLSRDRLFATYLRLILSAIACCVPVTLLAFAFPKAILWLLGAKYEGLGGLVGWLILASCINYVAGLAWVMNRARKWVFWSGTVFEIVLLISVQTAYVVVVGVRTTREAVMFTFTSSFCFVAAHAYNAVYGFLKGPRADLPDSKARDLLPG
jgi:O-antigen/teichoic acid export membrane protein